MKWRKINNVIHRDLGYLCFGLTILYVISGIAVNHIQDWNPTYSITRSTTAVDLSGVDLQNNNTITLEVLSQLDEQSPLKNIFRVDANTLKIFVKNNNITVYLDRSEVFQEKSIKRPLLFEANFLHLNHAKKLWTWFADLYALALGILAITGLFVLRGKKGITGRGAWLTAAGILIPIFFLWLYT
ncbi:MAG: hypothetical protein D6B25_03695 [Desulfobulbaceae bacterium]|nr:MAG: hypothetical protein D6B25_03695 [Desulfobulbaceae bacterium]